MEHSNRPSDVGAGVDLDTLLGTADPCLDSASVAVILRATGTVMRQVRLARGLALVEAAEQCRISTSVLCRAELARREPRLHLLLTLCGVLGVRLSAVLQMAEDEAFPVGTPPWTAHPANLLSHSPGCAAFLASNRSATSGEVDHG